MKYCVTRPQKLGPYWGLVTQFVIIDPNLINSIIYFMVDEHIKYKPVMLPWWLSPVAPWIVIKTWCAVSDNKIDIMTPLGFQCHDILTVL